MSKASDKAPDKTKVLEVAKMPDQTEAQAVAWVAVNPETNAAFVIDAFQSNTVGNDVSFMALIEALRKSTDQSKGGDLSHLEAMLISQATACRPSSPALRGGRRTSNISNTWSHSWAWP